MAGVSEPCSEELLSWCMAECGFRLNALREESNALIAYGILWLNSESGVRARVFNALNRVGTGFNPKSMTRNNHGTTSYWGSTSQQFVECLGWHCLPQVASRYKVASVLRTEPLPKELRSFAMHTTHLLTALEALRYVSDGMVPQSAAIEVTPYLSSISRATLKKLGHLPRIEDGQG